jgi:hypothetical protein
VETKGIENIFNKIIGEYFANLEKETVIQDWEAFRTSNSKTKKNCPRYIIKTFNTLDKKEYLKLPEKRVIRITVDYSTEALKGGGHRKTYFKHWNKVNAHIDWKKNKTLYYEQKLREFINAS